MDQNNSKTHLMGVVTLDSSSSGTDTEMEDEEPVVPVAVPTPSTSHTADKNKNYGALNSSSARKRHLMAVLASSSDDEDDNDTQAPLDLTSIWEQNTEPMFQEQDDPPVLSREATASSSRGKRHDGDGSSSQHFTPPMPDKVKQRKQKIEFLKLIEVCDEIKEKAGFDHEDESVLMENFTNSANLIEQMEACPSVMHLAYSHVESATDVVRNKTSKLGKPQNAFNMERFLIALMAENADRFHEYDSAKAIQNISQSGIQCSAKLNRALTDLCGVVSSPEEDKVGPIPVIPKLRAPPRKQRGFDETLSQATQHESISLNAGRNQTESKAKVTDEKLSKEIRKVVLDQTERNPGEPLHLYDLVLDKDSFKNTVTHLFNAAHLVKDGQLELYKDGSSRKKGDSALAVKPAPTDEGARTRQELAKQKQRRQHIVTFSAKQFREIQGNASGDSMIKLLQQKKK